MHAQKDSYHSRHTDLVMTSHSHVFNAAHLSSCNVIDVHVAVVGADVEPRTEELQVRPLPQALHKHTTTLFCDWVYMGGSMLINYVHSGVSWITK